MEREGGRWGSKLYFSHPYFELKYIRMTIVEGGWNLWVWLVGMVSRRQVWLVGGIYGCG